MTDRHKHLLHAVMLAAALGGPLPKATAGPLEDARHCALEARRLERLACFDAIFGTPVPAVPDRADRVPEAPRSERWRQAFADHNRHADNLAPIYRDTGRAAGQLVMVPALGVQPPRPRLVLQCHNNITELTLMTPEALDDERVHLAIGAEAMVWRVRDRGFVLSGGRGLPSIRTVKAMLAFPDARIESATPGIDGLLFDLTGFKQAIEPLRETCGW